MSYKNVTSCKNEIKKITFLRDLAVHQVKKRKIQSYLLRKKLSVT